MAATLLCAPIVAESVDEMLEQMRNAKSAGAQVAELRVDYIRGFDPSSDLPKLINSRVLPVIITYRPNWEGGLYEGEEGPRTNALSLAIELEADFIDIELQTVAEDFIAQQSEKRKSSCTRIIVSNHNYHATPSKEVIGDLVARIQSTGADIVKFVTTAQNVTDVANVFHMLVHSQVCRGLVEHFLAFCKRADSAYAAPTYVLNGQVHCPKLLYDWMPQHNVVSHMAMLQAYAFSGQVQEMESIAMLTGTPSCLQG